MQHVARSRLATGHDNERRRLLCLGRSRHWSNQSAAMIGAIAAAVTFESIAANSAIKAPTAYDGENPCSRPALTASQRASSENVAAITSLRPAIHTTPSTCDGCKTNNAVTAAAAHGAEAMSNGRK